MMLHVLLAALLTALASVVLPTDWQPVEAAECGFAVSMPDTPTVTADTVQAAMGQIITRSYTAADEPDTYTVGCSTFPATFFASVDESEFLDSGVERFAEGTGGEALFLEEAEIDGHPGRRYAVRIGEAVIYNEAYVVGRRVYQLSASRWAEADFDEDEGLSRFFGSFELRR